MDEKEQYRRFAEQWRIAGPVLQKIRDDELRQFTDVMGFIELMNEPFQYALKSKPIDQSSGLVELQKDTMKFFNIQTP
jgi:hypothetical protein